MQVEEASSDLLKKRAARLVADLEAVEGNELAEAALLECAAILRDASVEVIKVPDEDDD